MAARSPKIKKTTENQKGPGDAIAQALENDWLPEQDSNLRPID